MRDLYRTELRMTHFGGRSPQRALPQDWGTIAQLSPPKSGKPPRVWPSPQDYTPKHAVLSTTPASGAILDGTTPPPSITTKTVKQRPRNSSPRQTKQRRRHTNTRPSTVTPIMSPNDRRRLTESAIAVSRSTPSFPGPGQYDIKHTALGTEWDMVNGTERSVKMSSFHGVHQARALPQDWGTIRTTSPPRVDPNRPAYVTPSPMDYDPKPASLSTMPLPGSPKMAMVGGPGAVSRVAKPRTTPGPGEYDIKQMATGREWEVASVTLSGTGSERARLSSFAGRTPARTLPQDWELGEEWGTMAQRSVPRADSPKPAYVTPSANAYHPKPEVSSTMWSDGSPRLAKAGQFGTTSRIPPPPSNPGPGEYAIKQMPKGHEWQFAEMTDAERSMQSAAFTSRTPSRASPLLWHTPEVFSLQDERVDPAQ